MECKEQSLTNKYWGGKNDMFPPLVFRWQWKFAKNAEFKEAESQILIILPYFMQFHLMKKNLSIDTDYLIGSTSQWFIKLFIGYDIARTEFNGTVIAWENSSEPFSCKTALHEAFQDLDSGDEVLTITI